MVKFFCAKKNGTFLLCGSLFFFITLASNVKAAIDPAFNYKPQITAQNEFPITSSTTNSTNADGTTADTDNIALPTPETTPDTTATSENTAQTPIEIPNTYDVSQGNLWDEIPYFFQLPDYSQRPEVMAQIRWLQKHQKYFDHVIEQSTPYIYYVYEQARKRNMPPELIFLPIIESAYNSFAYSNKGAYGFWQMMPGTAAILGLKINWWYDGRSDLVASTNAAFDFLTDLSTQFNNDWLLAIAGYNCGPTRVQKAIEQNIRAGLPTDFWSLHLPHETRDYVSTFLAIEAISRAPDHYGLKLRPINNAPYLKVVKLTTQIDLKQVAKMAGVSEATLKKLNPGLKRWATNPEAAYSLVLPVEHAQQFERNLANLSEAEQVTWQIHKAKSGETLKSLADKYNTTSDTLIRVNHLQSNKIHSGQQLLIPINAQNTENITIPEKLPQPTSKPAPTKHKVIYHVKATDTLAKIANKFAVTQKQIRTWNNLKLHQKLKPQQKLIIYVPIKHKKSVSKKTTANYIRHKVAPKETIYRIASNFGISVARLEKINHIKNHQVHTGQILKIPR